MIKSLLQNYRETDCKNEIQNTDCKIRIVEYRLQVWIDTDCKIRIARYSKIQIVEYGLQAIDCRIRIISY